MTKVRVASVNDLKDGEAKTVQAEGQEIALYKVNGEFFATTNKCVHKGGPLGEGELEGNIIICPWHGWKFDVRTGISPVNPAAQVKTFPVTVEGDDVFVEV